MLLKCWAKKKRYICTCIYSLAVTTTRQLNSYVYLMDFQCGAIFFLFTINRFYGCRAIMCARKRRIKYTHIQIAVTQRSVLRLIWFRLSYETYRFDTNTGTFFFYFTYLRSVEEMTAADNMKACIFQAKRKQHLSFLFTTNNLFSNKICLAQKFRSHWKNKKKTKGTIYRMDDEKKNGAFFCWKIIYVCYLDILSVVVVNLSKIPKILFKFFSCFLFLIRRIVFVSIQPGRAGKFLLFEKKKHFWTNLTPLQQYRMVQQHLLLTICIYYSLFLLFFFSFNNSSVCI